jgi:hypothetical protein
MRINQFRAAALAAFVVVAASLAGCAGQPAPASAPTPTASASPAPTPEAVVGPERLFGGDCAELFDDAALAADVGTPLALQSAPRDLAPEYAAPAQLGGLSCHWSGSADAASSWLSVVVLPESVLAGPEDTESECVEGYGCTFRASSNGFALFGVHHHPSSPTADVVAAYEALVVRFASVVSTEPQPERYLPSGAWPSGIDCFSIDAQRLVGAAIGEPGLAPSTAGGDAEPNHGYYRAGEAADATPCGWFGDARSVRLHVLPGGAWVEDDVAALPGAAPATVPGATAAYVVDDLLHVFAGANWFTMRTEPAGAVDGLYPGASALIAEFDAVR